MCRFQREINSKIQEKKVLALEAVCPTESSAGEGSHCWLSCERTSEEVPEGLDGNTHGDSLGEASSDENQQYGCGEKSVGTASLHGCVQHGLCRFIACYS